MKSVSLIGRIYERKKFPARFRQENAETLNRVNHLAPCLTYMSIRMTMPSLTRGGKNGVIFSCHIIASLRRVKAPTSVRLELIDFHSLTVAHYLNSPTSRRLGARFPFEAHCQIFMTINYSFHSLDLVIDLAVTSLPHEVHIRREFDSEKSSVVRLFLIHNENRIRNCNQPSVFTGCFHVGLNFSMISQEPN
jgi:hypothetical protein